MEAIKRGQAYVLYFMAYSIIGWLYEVFLEVVVYGWEFSNRGVLLGPYLPVYGVGALAILCLLRRLRNRNIIWRRICITPFLVFFGVALIATGIELAASYFLEWTTGSWLWDYQRFAFDFQGRIALNPSIRFGLWGLCVFYGIQPWLERKNGRLTEKSRSWLAGAVLVVLSMEIIYWMI